MQTKITDAKKRCLLVGLAPDRQNMSKLLFSVGFGLGWDGDTVGSQAGSGHTPAFTLVQHPGGECPVSFFTF